MKLNLTTFFWELPERGCADGDDGSDSLQSMGLSSEYLRPVPAPTSYPTGHRQVPWCKSCVQCLPVPDKPHSGQQQAHQEHTNKVSVPQSGKEECLSRINTVNYSTYDSRSAGSFVSSIVVDSQWSWQNWKETNFRSDALRRERYEDKDVLSIIPLFATSNTCRSLIRGSSLMWYPCTAPRCGNCGWR
jgi:hypothetical protein